MKDHRFIELVNLYIDRQITADETAELEAEIQGNPRRRAVYRQYCRMHHATTLVYDSFRAQAPDQAAAAPATRSTIVRFESQRRGRGQRWAYYAGGLAAAACFAFVFARLNNQPAGDNPGMVATGDSHPAAVVATIQPPAPSTPVREAAVPPARQVSSLRYTTDETDYPALIAILRQEEQRNNPAQAGRRPSLFEDGAFESQQFFPVINQRTFRSRQTPAQQAEFTAFQFQR
jgi:hypothetical protein